LRGTACRMWNRRFFHQGFTKVVFPIRDLNDFPNGIFYDMHWEIDRSNQLTKKEMSML